MNFSQFFMDDESELSVTQIKNLVKENTIKENQRLLCRKYDRSFQKIRDIKNSIVNKKFQQNPEKNICNQQHNMNNLQNTKANSQQNINQRNSSYHILRTAWTKFESTCNPPQKIDNLNKVVGMIKNNINKMITEQSQAKPIQQIRQFNTSYKNRMLEMDYQRTKMQNQDLRMQVYRLEEKVKKLSSKIQKIEEIGENCAFDKKRRMIYNSLEAKYRVTIDCLNNSSQSQACTKTVKHKLEDILTFFNDEKFSLKNASCLAENKFINRPSSISNNSIPDLNLQQRLKDSISKQKSYLTSRSSRLTPQKPNLQQLRSQSKKRFFRQSHLYQNLDDELATKLNC